MSWSSYPVQVFYHPRSFILFEAHDNFENVVCSFQTTLSCLTTHIYIDLCMLWEQMSSMFKTCYMHINFRWQECMCTLHVLSMHAYRYTREKVSWRDILLEFIRSSFHVHQCSISTTFQHFLVLQICTEVSHSSTSSYALSGERRTRYTDFPQCNDFTTVDPLWKNISKYSIPC